MSETLKTVEIGKTGTTAPIAPELQPAQLELAGTVAEDDPLAQCLSQFISQTDRPVAMSALLAGLPLEKGKLNPALMLRVLDRADYGAVILKRKLPRIAAIYLPAILFMGDGDACILLEKNGKKCRIKDPLTKTDHVISTADLAKDYSGVCIYARRNSAKDFAETEIVTRTGGHWFWSAVRIKKVRWT